jgi:hypothetical protein
MITQAEIHRLFEYNADTGAFVRKVKTAIAAKVGDKAGYLNKQGYIQMRVAGKTYQAHSLAWLYVHGEIPAMLDHIDGDRSNNAINNLRIADKSINGFNREKKSDSSSVFKGVLWSKKYKKWEAKINANRKRTHLGYFDCEQEAAHAYNKSAVELHGEYARLNPVGVKGGA